MASNIDLPSVESTPTDIIANGIIDKNLKILMSEKKKCHCYHHSMTEMKVKNWKIIILPTFWKLNLYFLKKKSNSTFGA